MGWPHVKVTQQTVGIPPSNVINPTAIFSTEVGDIDYTGATAVLFNNSIYILGGNAVPFNQVRIYNIANRAWNNGVAAPESLQNARGIAFEESVFMFGPDRRVQQYNLLTGRWDTKAQAPEDVSNATIVQYGTMARLYIGTTWYEYNLRSNVWSSPASEANPVNMSNLSAVVFNGFIYVFAPDAVYEHLIAPDYSWRNYTGPTFNTDNTFATNIQNIAYVVGSSNTSGSVQIFDMDTKTWTLGAEAPGTISGYAGVAADNSLIYMFGASTNYVYNIAGNTWSTIGSESVASYALAPINHEEKVVAINYNSTDPLGVYQLTGKPVYGNVAMTKVPTAALTHSAKRAGIAVARERIYVIGSNNTYSNVIQIFNTSLLSVDNTVYAPEPLFSLDGIGTFVYNNEVYYISPNYPYNQIYKVTTSNVSLWNTCPYELRKARCVVVDNSTGTDSYLYIMTDTNLYRYDFEASTWSVTRTESFVDRTIMNAPGHMHDEGVYSNKVYFITNADNSITRYDSDGSTVEIPNTQNITGAVWASLLIDNDSEVDGRIYMFNRTNQVISLYTNWTKARTLILNNIPGLSIPELLKDGTTTSSSVTLRVRYRDTLGLLPFVSYSGTTRYAAGLLSYIPGSASTTPSRSNNFTGFRFNLDTLQLELATGGVSVTQPSEYYTNSFKRGIPIIQSNTDPVSRDLPVTSYYTTVNLSGEYEERNDVQRRTYQYNVLTNTITAVLGERSASLSRANTHAYFADPVFWGDFTRWQQYTTSGIWYRDGYQASYATSWSEGPKPSLSATYDNPFIVVNDNIAIQLPQNSVESTTLVLNKANITTANSLSSQQLFYNPGGSILAGYKSSTDTLVGVYKDNSTLGPRIYNFTVDATTGRISGRTEQPVRFKSLSSIASLKLAYDPYRGSYHSLTIPNESPYNGNIVYTEIVFQNDITNIQYETEVYATGLTSSIMSRAAASPRAEGGINIALTWQDPEDTILENQLLVSWADTVIVRKDGSAPESINDGVKVVVNTTRNAYMNTPFIDNVDSLTWVYKAFPRTQYELACNNYRNIFTNVSRNAPLYTLRVPLTTDAWPNNSSYAHGYYAYCSYEDDASNFIQARPIYGGIKLNSWADTFLRNIKPAMVKYDGTLDYFLDSKDLSLKEDGTESDYNNTSYEGNMMLGIPTVYYDVKYERGSKLIQMSSGPVDNLQPWAHTDASGNVCAYKFYSMIPAELDSNGNFRSINSLYTTVTANLNALAGRTHTVTTLGQDNTGWAPYSTNMCSPMSLADYTLLYNIMAMLLKYDEHIAPLRTLITYNSNIGNDDDRIRTSNFPPEFNRHKNVAMFNNYNMFTRLYMRFFYHQRAAVGPILSPDASGWALSYNNRPPFDVTNGFRYTPSGNELSTRPTTGTRFISTFKNGMYIPTTTAIPNGTYLSQVMQYIGPFDSSHFNITSVDTDISIFNTVKNNYAMYFTGTGGTQLFMAQYGKETL